MKTPTQTITGTISVDLKLLPERAPRLPLPSHFYGEIGKTKEGAKRLKESGHVEKLASRVYDEEFSTLYRRGAMISLAHIGSSDNGFRVLNECAREFVPYCLNLVKTTKKLSLRGTVFVVAGLLSQSAHGRQTLADHGWSSPESPAAVSIPTDTTRVFSHDKNKDESDGSDTKKQVEEEEKKSSKETKRRQLRGGSVASIYLVAEQSREDEEKEDIPEILKPKLAEIHTADLDDVRKQIMDHIIQLSNGIINATARKRLLELKTSTQTQKGTSSPFMDPSFFSLVLRQTLNASSLTLASRQFVLFELFGELLEQNGMSLLAEEMSASSRPTSPSSSSRPGTPKGSGMRRSPSREFRLDIRE
mgnify:FL=1